MSFHFHLTYFSNYDQRSRDEHGVKQLYLLEVALNDLRWIHLDVKIIVASNKWCNKAIIEDLEQSYRKGEAIDYITFKLAQVDEQPCCYDMNKFMMFYGDIIARLRISPPFTFFEVDALNTNGVCPSQLTWNAWAFVLCFEVIYTHHRLNLLINAFFFFFTYT